VSRSISTKVVAAVAGAVQWDRGIAVFEEGGAGAASVTNWMIRRLRVGLA
jgi:hypothetical protein